MSEEIRTADANLHALHAERAALRLAAQTAGIVVWLDGDTYHASLNDAEATGATPGAALVALCVRLGEALDATSAELAAADHCATVAQHALDASRADLERLRAELTRRDAEHEAFCTMIRKNGVELHTGATFEVTLRDCQGYGGTPGIALLGLVFALNDDCGEREREIERLRADLDTLRNGVAWLGSELDRVKAWAGRWKRAAKRSARDWRDLVAAYEDMRAENAAVRRAARQLVVAWRKERAATEDARKDARYFLSELEAFIPDAATRLAEIKQRWPRLWKITRAPEVEPPQNDAETE